MARGKKTERVLTPEEKLEQALVPIEEQPYPVPENWCWVKLASICNNIRAGGDKPQNFSEVKTAQMSVPIVANGVQNDGIIGYTDMANEQSGTVTIAGRGTIGFSVVRRYSYFPVVRLISLTPNCSVIPDYIKYIFDVFEEKGTGSSIPQLTVPIVATKKIPLAPLPEQQRIINRIESLFAKLDEAKEKVQAVIDGFETRKARILHKAFTGKLTSLWRKDNFSEASLLLKQIDEEISKTRKKTIKKVVNVIDENYMKLPNNWLIVDLDRISKKITDGEHKTPSRVNSYCGYYLLSARNIYNDSLQLDDVDYVDESEYGRISKRCNPHKGDVLISCSGSVGRTCVIDDDNNYCMVRSAAMVSISKCNARYVMYAIQSDIVQHQIKRLSKQTAQANLFIGAIAAINIPLPPIEEQIEIVRIIDKIITKEMRTKNIAENILEQIDTMKKSILARAFRGELGTNDPSEERATKLLGNRL